MTAVIRAVLVLALFWAAQPAHARSFRELQADEQFAHGNYKLARALYREALRGDPKIDRLWAKYDLAYVREMAAESTAQSAASVALTNAALSGANVVAGAAVATGEPPVVYSQLVPPTHARTADRTLRRSHASDEPRHLAHADGPAVMTPGHKAALALNRGLGLSAPMGAPVEPVNTGTTPQRTAALEPAFDRTLPPESDTSGPGPRPRIPGEPAGEVPATDAAVAQAEAAGRARAEAQAQSSAEAAEAARKAQSRAAEDRVTQAQAEAVRATAAARTIQAQAQANESAIQNRAASDEATRAAQAAQAAEILRSTGIGTDELRVPGGQPANENRIPGGQPATETRIPGGQRTAAPRSQLTDATQAAVAQGLVPETPQAAAPAAPTPAVTDGTIALAPNEIVPVTPVQAGEALTASVGAHGEPLVVRGTGWDVWELRFGVDLAGRPHVVGKLRNLSGSDIVNPTVYIGLVDPAGVQIAFKPVKLVDPAGVLFPGASGEFDAEFPALNSLVAGYRLYALAP